VIGGNNNMRTDNDRHVLKVLRCQHHEMRLTNQPPSPQCFLKMFLFYVHAAKSIVALWVTDAHITKTALAQIVAYEDFTTSSPSMIFAN